MKTEILIMDENNINQKEIEKAGSIIKQGGLVAFPTETVYGLGGDALNPKSSAKIYEAKGRPSDNPLIIHISNIEALPAIVQSVPEEIYRLAEAFWPGPLTIIFKKSDLVPKETTGGLDTVAVRMPAHETALALIEAAGGYIAAPSANVSGRPSPTLAKHVVEDMNGRIDMILDGGAVGIGLESTIIDMTSCTPMILRPGYITQDMLFKVLGSVEIDETILSMNSKVFPKAPGMKYKHYAPKGELTIVSGEMKHVIAEINERLMQKKAAGEKTGVIVTEETKDLYDADVVKSVGKRRDEEMIARQLYKVLREFDDENVTWIYSEAFYDMQMSKAVMNRLLKAAGHRVIEV